MEWKYLDGDGDFRSDEVKALRDEADIIITNPPFSVYIDFMRWLIEADQEFLKRCRYKPNTLQFDFCIFYSSEINLSKTKKPSHRQHQSAGA